MVWQWIHLVTKGAQWEYLEKYLKIFWYTQDLFCYIVQIFCILVWRLHKTDFITSIMAIVAKMFFQHRYLMIKVSHANLVPVPQTYKRLKDYINQTNYSCNWSPDHMSIKRYKIEKSHFYKTLDFRNYLFLLSKQVKTDAGTEWNIHRLRSLT